MHCSPSSAEAATELDKLTQKISKWVETKRDPDRRDLGQT